MKNKYISYLSLGTLITGAAIGVYALTNTYLIKSKLPPDVCQVTANRPLMYTAVAFLAVSFILSFFEPREGK